MKKTIVSIFVSFVITTSSWATSEYEDDCFNHVTRTAKGDIEHTRKVVKSDMMLSSVWYDQSQPNGKQLSFRVQRQDIEHTRPAVPGVPGLEPARHMGTSRQTLALFDSALIELVYPDKPVTDFKRGFPIPAGEYDTYGHLESSGSVELHGDMKKTKYKLWCGNSSGTKAEIEFVETTYNFPHGLNLQSSSARDISAAPLASDIYTVSCWYLADADARNDKTLPIFTATYPATEAGLENQFKTFTFGIKNLTTKNSYRENLSHLTFTYPVLKPGEVRTIKAYKEVMVDEMKTKVIPKSTKTEAVEWSSLTNQQGLEFYTNGRLPDGYSSSSMPTQGLRTLKCRSYLQQEKPHEPLKACCFPPSTLWKTTVTPKTTYEIPTGRKIPAIKKVKSFEPTFVMETKEHCSSSPVVSDNLMHLMLIVNAQAKTATAYCNDQELWKVACPELVSLKAAGKHTFGPHPAELSEVFVLDGLHQASEFGCFNCHNQWIPKKYVGQPGVNGYSPQARKFNTLR